MYDGSSGLSDWGAYLRRMTGRPGWSVARLAREAGIHRATIFDWIRGGGESVTIASVRAVATALGDDLENTLRAVAGLETSRQARDEEMDMIMSAPVDDDMKRKMITRALELREQDRQQRIQVLRWLMAAEQDAPELNTLGLATPGDDNGGASEGATG
jgi:transcriptional regulator with XRE-family HTH domain